MPLPQMHGRTHIPTGYAAVVQAVSDPASLAPQATTDQVPCVVGGAAEVAILSGWEADTTGNVTANTWINTGSIGFWNDFYDPPSMSVNSDSGTITTQLPDAWFFAGAEIQFNFTFTAGDIIGVAINTGGGRRIINSITCGPSGLFGDHKLSVWCWEYGIPSFAVEVYQTNAGSVPLRDSRLAVSRGAPLDPAFGTGIP